MFPASEEGIFAIHSTDGYGNPSPYNSTALALQPNFCILGEHIESAWPSKDTAGETRRLRGTSFATPIAACLAAFLLDYVHTNIHNINGYFYQPRSSVGMKKLFMMMHEERPPNSNYHLLLPVSFFKRREALVLEQIKEILAEIVIL